MCSPLNCVHVWCVTIRVNSLSVCTGTIDANELNPNGNNSCLWVKTGALESHLIWSFTSVNVTFVSPASHSNNCLTDLSYERLDVQQQPKHFTAENIIKLHVCNMSKTPKV